MDELKCTYCGCTYNVLIPTCPHCGAPNDVFLQREKGVPKTLVQLKRYCEERQLDTKRLRFFIDENCEEPKAYGLFRDERGNFVVYKNHSEGSRKVYYIGGDEAYAVNLIYEKLGKTLRSRRRHHHRHHHHHSSGTGTTSRARDHLRDPSSVIGRKHQNQKRLRLLIAAALLMVLLVFGMILRAALTKPVYTHNGYYRCDGVYYYSQNDEWFRYDASGGWQPVQVSDGFLENYADYYLTAWWSADYKVTDFRESKYYVAPERGSGYDDDGWAWDNGEEWIAATDSK